jgi:uncharacterized alpha-E superfamily protein
MLSRVADSLYWMSRYLERAENTARQLDVTMTLMLDGGASRADLRWNRLVESLGISPGLEWTGDMDEAAHRLIFERDNPASITYCTTNARENARQVREEISTEQWQRLNRLFHHIHSPLAQEQFINNVGEFLSSVIDGIHLFKGVTDTTMIHGQGWQFIRLGRYLERAYATATLLEVFQQYFQSDRDQDVTGYHYLEQVGLLRCCTAFEAYCQFYTAEVSTDRIIEFLLLNSQFPHAIRYSVDSTLNAIEAIQQSSGRRTSDELKASIGRLHAMLRYTTVQEILSGSAVMFLHSIRRECMRIHQQIYRQYVHYSIQAALAV